MKPNHGILHITIMLKNLTLIKFKNLTLIKFFVTKLNSNAIQVNIF